MLPSDSCLWEHNIQQNTWLTVTAVDNSYPAEGRTMVKLDIRGLSTSRRTILTTCAEPIQNIWDAIAALPGAPERFRISAHGCTLDRDRWLTDYGIHANATIDVLPQLEGGAHVPALPAFLNATALGYDVRTTVNAGRKLRGPMLPPPTCHRPGPSQRSQPPHWRNQNWQSIRWTDILGQPEWSGLRHTTRCR